ncbi:MAG TPA: hypothetical protein VNC15_06560, partial [Solirubrobacterales bacterium]|nr:hypothetical protein [Solirubrobacterales bacterium]
LALFIAVGGASAFAATQLPKNSVGTKQLKKGAVNTAKIKDEAVAETKIRNGAVTGAKIKPGTIGASALASGVIPPPVNAYTKTESDSRYLRGTVTVVGTIPEVAADNFESGSVECPAGYQATGGGVDPSNVFFGKVSSSAPTFNGSRALDQSVGQHGPATGWEGVISTQGASTGSSGPSKIVVICSPIG